MQAGGFLLMPKISANFQSGGNWGWGGSHILGVTSALELLHQTNPDGSF